MYIVTISKYLGQNLARTVDNFNEWASCHVTDALGVAVGDAHTGKAGT
jgi:hypothetical protein